MEYGRLTVIDRINSLKGKKRTDNYKSNFRIAEHLGVDERTVKNWLNKKPGHPDIPFKYIPQICDYLGCDIEYLLDGDMHYKTKEAKDICKITGLTEEAVEILKFVNNGKTEQSKFENSYDYEYFKALCSAFLDIVNVIIESSNADNFWERSGYRTRKVVSENSKRNIFPTNAIADFIAKVRKANEPIDDRELLELETESSVMANRWKNMSKYEYNAYLIDEWKKPYDRRDIQDAIMEFLKGDFVENGKAEER